MNERASETYLRKMEPWVAIVLKMMAVKMKGILTIHIAENILLMDGCLNFSKLNGQPLHPTFILLDSFKT
jgi:hypothetical protein